MTLPQGSGKLSAMSSEPITAFTSAQLAERYGAVSMTLEMPFKDNDDLPDAEYGWSPARSMQLGRDCLAALAEMIDAI